MGRKLLSVIATAAALATGHLAAASLHEAAMVGQIQQQSNNNEIDACGVTISAMELRSGPPTGKTLVFNGSVMIYGIEGGLMKGRASEIDARQVAAGKFDFNSLKPLPTVTTWMKAPNKPLTAPMAGTKVQSSDDPGYRIYASDFDSVIGVIDAVLEKKVIQVGMKIQNTNTDRVLFGTVQISEAEHEQLRNCMSEWVSTMKKRYKVNDADSQPGEEKK